LFFHRSVILTFIILIIFFQHNVYAQTDSTVPDKTESFMPFLLPLVLISAGAAVSGSEVEKDIQKYIRESAGNDFSCQADDYIVFMPAAEVYIFDWMGFKAKNNFWDRTKNMVLANLASQALVQGLKYTTDKERPNGEDRYSFPSNHTNVAFTNATILFHEYKDSNNYIAYSGFVFAAATGALRIMNNDHWTGDVLAGAGIGILCSNLVYHFEPLKEWQPFETGKDKNIVMLPQFGKDRFGMILSINF